MAHSLQKLLTKSRRFSTLLYSQRCLVDSESTRAHFHSQATKTPPFAFHSGFDHEFRNTCFTLAFSSSIRRFSSSDIDREIIEGGSSSVSNLGEVAAAAADSFFPVAVLQHFIDAIHVHAGLNWWASIAVATLIIRSATLPLLIKQLKVTTNLTRLRPRLDDIRREIEEKGMDPAAMSEGQKKMKSLFKEYGVSPFGPFIGMLIQGPVFISFFFAISNMVEKMGSFKSGGTLWFCDLTTPDDLYIFPVITALSILVTVECNMQEGLEGNPIAPKLKKVFRVFAIAAAPLTITFPKALFCYWVTSNLFSMGYGLVLKIPGVKKSLGVPEITLSQSATEKDSVSSHPTDKMQALEDQIKRRKEEDTS